jgi:hypothetical protein
MAQRHPRRGAGGAGSGGAVETRPGSRRRGGEEEADKRGSTRQRGEREKAPMTEGVNPRRKRLTQNTSRQAWAGRLGRGELGQSAGRLGRRPSGPGRVVGPKVKKKDF